MQQSHQNPPVITGSTSGIGKAVGIVAAVLATPALFEATRLPLLRYLARMYGVELASWLSWGLGIVEGLVIYHVTVVVFAFGLSWFLAWLAARGLTR